MTKKSPRKRVAPARNLCKHFDGSNVVGCARPGLSVLLAEHKAIITGGTGIACGVELDRCRRPHDPDSRRWDYVFVERDSDAAVGIEVHHAAADEVRIMIEKKTWATELLASQCPNLQVTLWLWIAAPDGEILFPRQHPEARRLAEAGIEFPVKRVPLP